MYYLLISLIILSSLFSISSNSWINMWIGMEINLISFLPLMINNSNSFSSESMIKYFIIQTFASINFIFISLTKMLFFPLNQFHIFMIILLMSTLLMKMGASPFHSWFPQIMKTLNWQNCLILSTWQKIIPMIILSYIFMYNFMIIPIILSSSIGSILGMNQSNLKLIMSYSSINHISWLLCSLMMHLMNWLIYFFVYSITNFILISFFKKFKIYYFNQFISTSILYSTKLFIMLNFLSLSGLPPFIGFFPKWFIINFLILNNFLWVSLILILNSLITIFFYLRLCFNSLIINYDQPKWSLSYHYSTLQMISMFSSFTVFNLFFMTLIFQVM
uniref:NADH-ubiquinone oxidoreductase chain 2 n=1 Tax=Marilia sp. XG-2021 TaxID=2996736 RepID=A0A9E8LNY4_9NEOP|nr:NADH dehydrogenase subunit 2 [Marilia sp. XG-2021]